jgi:glutamyl-tRNA reductase
MSNKSTALNLPLSYFGAHFSRCPVEIRELWTRSFDSAQGRIRLAEIARRHFGDVGIVPVFTCNRFDICVDAALSEAALLAFFSELTKEAAAGLLSQVGSTQSSHASQTSEWSEGRLYSQKLRCDVSEILAAPQRLSSLLRFAEGAAAASQLFRVAASLDSLVLGEPHILGQLKEQVAVARDLGLLSSSVEGVFSRAFSIAKRVRSETDLGRNAVSIGHAAVALAGRVFEDFSKHRALVIGAGEMARLASQHLSAHGISDLSIANRTLVNAQNLSQLIGGRANALSLEEALSQLLQYDVIIVATSSRETLLRREHFADFKRARKGDPQVIVDVSVPRNVDPSCTEVSSNLYVFDVDDLDKVMEYNRELRKEAADRAERLIAEDLDSFLKSQLERDNLKNVGGFHRLVRHTVVLELQKTVRRQGAIRDLSQLEVIADAVAKRLVAAPAEKARAGKSALTQTVGQALGELFELEAFRESDESAPDIECASEKLVSSGNE